MPQLAQPSFTSGELAPSLFGRVDLARYLTGLKRCENFIVRREGGVCNRAGFQFLGLTRYTPLESQPPRLLPFQFSATQTYVLEVGTGYLRFWRSGGLLRKASAPAWDGLIAYMPGVYVMVGSVMYTARNASTNEYPPDHPELWEATDIYQLITPYLVSLDLLQVTQSADVMTIVHPLYPPMELRRSADDDWALILQPRIPAIGSPPPLGLTANTTAVADSMNPQPLKGYSWVVTAVDANGQESLPSVPITSSVNLQVGKPASVTWPKVTGAVSYNVYRARNGIYGYIGSANKETSPNIFSFEDDNFAADYADAPPTWKDPFTGANKYPGVVGYYQQRLIMAATFDRPQTLWLSRVGDYRNFGAANPPHDDDSIEYTLVDRQVQQIEHVVTLDRLVVLTSGGEWLVVGDQDGILSPAAMSLDKKGNIGCSGVPPVSVGDSALFVQEKGSVVRDLFFSVQDEVFSGNDLSVMATHLFDGHRIVDWAYSQIPFSVVWAVREDGLLIALTYMREQQVWGWHRHTTDGLVKHVCVVSEGQEDALYLLIERTIGGIAQNFVERLHTRIATPSHDCFFVDAGLSFEGWGNVPHALTLPGAAAAYALVTVTSVGPAFNASDVNGVLIFKNGGTPIRFTVLQFLSNTQVQVQGTSAISAELAAGDLAGHVSAGQWAMGRTLFSGLDHLEGKTVAILADGNVVPSQEVVDGQITVTDPAAVVHAGLPYNADMQTLDLASPPTALRNRQKAIEKVGILVQDTRGIAAGPDADHLDQFKQDQFLTYDEPVLPETDLFEIQMDNTWEKRGSFLVRQPYPLPATILALIPDVAVGG